MPYGDSKAMSKVRALVEQVGPTSSTVLIRGESGTGKEIVARALHRASHRAARALIKIDCTALPEPLLESELFGHEKGAFTGAGQRKLGRVELAQGGTLFLDEVGELTLPTQAKLLRLLQDRVLERLGGTQTISVDVRVVAATHRDLETMVERGEFRHDLFYRLNVIPIWIPPLRARREDIPELVRRFASDVAQRNGGVPKTFDEEAIRLISSERWPGNVRQLQNFVERLVVLSRSGAVSRSDVLGELQRPIQFATQTGPAGADAAAAPEPAGDDAALRLARHSAEREALVRALEQAGGKRSTAAKILGVCRSTLYLKLAEHGLS
jgi:two-component system response regulator AtoC